MRVDPDAVAFGAGAAVGGMIGTTDPGTLFVTVTLIPAEAATLPAASRATAVSVCVPSLTVRVFQEVTKGSAVTSAPRLTPSTLNWTPTTPTLSLALADTVTALATVAPAAGAVIETTGGVRSPLSTVTLTGADVVALPAASRASA